MADQSGQEKDFIKELQIDTKSFAEKAAGLIGVSLPHKPSGFVALHERATQLLLEVETERTFGIVKEEGPSEKAEETTGVTNKDLADMLVMMDKLDEVATGGETTGENSVLSLIPDDIVITGEGNKLLIKAIGEEIQAGKEKIPLKKALELAKKEEQARHRKKGEWENEPEKQKWESISLEDRSRISGIRRILSVAGLDPDSIAEGKLGAKEYVYKDVKTGQEVRLDEGDRIVRYEPKAKEGTPISDKATVITAKGERIDIKLVEEIKPVISDLGKDYHQEISLRQLLTDITRKRQGELANAYLTILQQRGQRIGWNEVGENRGMVIEGMGFGSKQYDVLMRALRISGYEKKWLATATLNEMNDRFVMFFEAKNRDQAQKEEAGAVLARLASGDNIAAWLEDIPDLAKILSFEEWQGLRNPWTGEPLDYPAVVYDESVAGLLNEKLSTGLVGTIVKAIGEEIKGDGLRNYQAETGDIFVLKPPDKQHRSMALIEVMRERAKNLGIETYVADLAFTFHRLMCTGADKGISYNKTMTTDDYLKIADMIGLGEQVREDYESLTPEQKKEFETFIKQTSVFQAGVESYFSVISAGKMIDQGPQNNDRYFRKMWMDRAPVYKNPSDWIKKRVSWGKGVDWERERVRREQYRWMGEFSLTLGKGLMDVTGKFAGKETPFDFKNSYHVKALTKYLMTSGVVEEHMKRVDLDRKSLGAAGLESVIRLMFEAKTLPKPGEINFLGELDKFNNKMGYEGGLRVQVNDFNNVDSRFRDAVRLEKILEQPGIFGNKLEFVGDDDWSPNQNLIDWVKGSAGVINESSYDRQVYKLLYWYANYLSVYDTFLRRRLGKEPLKPSDIAKRILPQWQDQPTYDVRGTPYQVMLHFANEEYDYWLREKISDGKLGHLALRDIFNGDERFWHDAAPLYQEPELNPEKYETKVQQYCRKRKLGLHHAIDVYYEEIHKHEMLTLAVVKDLTDPMKDKRMYHYADLTDEGELIGELEEGELRGAERDLFVRTRFERIARLFTLASQLEEGVAFYQLDMGSVWNDKLEIQMLSKDGEGLNKFEIMKTWYGIVENDVPLYKQFLDWYNQLKTLPKEAWEKGESGRYDGIPQVLVGFAREYFVSQDGRSLNLRADTKEAEAYRAFFRRWLYQADSATGYSNNGQNFNKPFQILMALMFAIDVGPNGINEDPSKGPYLPDLRYLYMRSTVVELVKGNKPEQLAFYDGLMKEKRFDGRSWEEFFKSYNTDRLTRLTKKETIIEEMGSLIRRDKMFSPTYSQFGKFVKQIFVPPLGRIPGEIDFDMAEEVKNALSKLTPSLPNPDQARRWIYMNYGVDIGECKNMAAVDETISKKVPREWEKYREQLERARHDLSGWNFLGMLSGKRWLDDSFFKRPNYDSAKEHLKFLSDHLVFLPKEAYEGFLLKAKTVAQNSLYGYEVFLVAGQKAMSDAEKTKKYYELRDKIYYGNFSWELLERFAEKMWGVGERPIDFSTDAMLALEHGPVPLISLATGVLASWKPLSPLHLLDSFLKKYIEPTWGGAIPVAAVEAFIIAGALNATLAVVPAIGLGLGAYVGIGWLGRGYMFLINKALEKRGKIERLPKVPWMITKGIIK